MNTRILIGALTALLIASVLAAPAAMAADWPQFHYDIANTGNSPSDAPDDNNTWWATADIGAVTGSQAMIVDNRVFVYANANVYALNKYTGGILWTASIPGDSLYYGMWASPAYSNDMVFVSAGYNLTKINAANGSIVEQIAMPNGMYTGNGGPTITDGMVFAGTYNQVWGGTDPATYYAFNENDLTDEKWNFTVDSPYAVSTPAVADGKVVFGAMSYSGTSSLYCVNKSANVNGGTDQQWVTSLNGVLGGSASIDAANDRVYVTTSVNWTLDTGRFYAINFTDGSIVRNESIVYSSSTPAISGEFIYVSGGSSAIGAPGVTYCFNQTAENWTVPQGGWTISPMVADGKLFTGGIVKWGGGNGIYAYDAITGTPVWSHAQGGSSPSVASSDPVVVTVGNDGKVYAFGPPVIVSCDETSWPQDEFWDESVWVVGVGLESSKDYDLWIQNTSIVDGSTLVTTNDPSGAQESATTNTDGDFVATQIWDDVGTGTPVLYCDIVADLNVSGTADGVYRATTDYIDSATGAGFVAPVPELASAMLVGGGLLMLVGAMRLRRKD